MWVNISSLSILICFIFGCAHNQKYLKAGLDSAKIRQNVCLNKKKFVACYNEALEKNPNAAGKIQVQWAINEKGIVEKTQIISSEIHDEDMKHCMARAIKEISFPAPPSGQFALISFPFIFVTGSDDAFKKSDCLNKMSSAQLAPNIGN